MTRAKLRGLIEGGLTQAHEAVVRSFLPNGARITFVDPPHEKMKNPPDFVYNDLPPEDEVDPDFLFGGWSMQSPQSLEPRKASFPTGKHVIAALTAAGKEGRKELAEDNAQSTNAVYGDILDRRDVFFEDAEKTETERYGKGGFTYTMPLSVLDSPSPRLHKH